MSVTVPRVQVDILGLEHLTSAFGVLTCIRGLSAFLGPPLGGFVIDATSPEKIVNATETVVANMTTIATEAATEAVAAEDTSNYQVAFWISAALLGTSSVGHLIAFFVKKVTQKNEANKKEATSA